MGLVPEDRKRLGLVLSMNARENISLPTIADHLHYDTTRPHAMRGETEQVLSLGGGMPTAAR